MLILLVTDNPLYYSNVLVLVRVMAWPHRIHTGLCCVVITIDAIVVFGAVRMRNIMLSEFRLL